MIRNERELRETKARLDDFREQVEATRRELEEQSTPEDHIRLATDPLEILASELEFDIQFYERLCTEGVRAVPSYPAEESGKELIALRIAKGWTQKQLAQALGVSEAQVSRDERNDYQGITQERRGRILTALGVEEHRVFQSTSEVAVQGVVIEMPIMHLEAASFGGAAASLSVGAQVRKAEDA